MSTTTHMPSPCRISTSSRSPLGVCVFAKAPLNRAQPVNYPGYIHEILDHAGVCYTPIAVHDLEKTLDQLRLLITVGEQELDAECRQRLTEWTHAGGAWLSIGGTCGMRDLLGVEHAPSSYPNWGAASSILTGEGYLLAVGHPHPVVAHLDRPLHFFNAVALRASSAKCIAGSLDHHQRGACHDVLFEHTVGSGRTITLAVDLTGTIVRIQQGTGVTRDGIPASDGTAPIADGVLKTDDGAVLDWIFDRRPVAGAPGLSLFLDPIADQWRELFLRAIFHLATTQKIALPLLWLYPHRLAAIAHMSHDTDGSEPQKAIALLDILAKEGIHSTWCVILPAYEPQILQRIKQAGHELATHYDAMTEGLDFSEAEFDRQHRQLRETFNETPVTNKNHYLRWEGDVEFYDWCASRGIELDQSKGPSKTGEAGFLFGSCHVSFPVTFDNRRINVLSLTTHTQDLGVFAPIEIAAPLIEAAKRAHGVVHFLFHPAHVDKPQVESTICHVIRDARNQGMAWWTARQINEWERARRTVLWSNYTCKDGIADVTLRSEVEMDGATVLWLNPSSAPSSANGSTMHAWGFSFTASVTKLRPGIETHAQFPVAGSTPA